MGIFNILTDIGVTIGKVALSLFSGNNCLRTDDGEYQLGSSYGDIVFVNRTKGSLHGIYICNVSPTNDYIITFPGENGEEGEIIYLNYLEELPVTDWFDENNSPYRTIYISLNKSEDLNGKNTSQRSMLNLSFNDLQLGGAPVILGGFKISSTERNNERGILVECQHAMGLSNLSSCMLRNKNGISLQTTELIAPKEMNDSEESRFYPLDYKISGLNENEFVTGLLNIELTDNKVLKKNCRLSSKIFPENVTATLKSCMR